MEFQDETLSNKPKATNFLVISAHDYRTPARANIHFIAEELAQRGKTRFFSLRYSMLSGLKEDARKCLDPRSNQKEMYLGVECFLWKTLVHPFNARCQALTFFEEILFWLYTLCPSCVLVEWIKEADVIIFESGVSIIYFDLACQLNPAAKKIYRASDDLTTIHAARYVQRALHRAAPAMASICLASPLLALGVSATNNLYYIPHGVDHSIADRADPSPYGEGIHAVSIGSMLFDPTFFEVASQEFPDITFHVIGSGLGRQSGYGPNVKVYGYMKHVETLRYMKHATFGIAAYTADVPEYLRDSSLKLVQFDFFGAPAVCPRKVVGNYISRFGYTPGDCSSIVAAIHAAGMAKRQSSRQYLNWQQVTDRLLDPQHFEDTRVRF